MLNNFLSKRLYSSFFEKSLWPSWWRIHKQFPIDQNLKKIKAPVLVDGPHNLRIASKDPFGKEGIQIIPFEVRNGPAIEIRGIKENAVLDDLVPIMINAYGKGDSANFLIEGSETPQGIPWWVWILIIGFVGWSMYYLFMYLSIG